MGYCKCEAWIGLFLARLAGKFGTKNVVIHSFNHLSSSKASPEFSGVDDKAELRKAAERRVYGNVYAFRIF